MIKDFEIIVATIVTNITKTGYTDVAIAACKSWAAAPYVDKVLVVDGQSIDNTVDILKEATGEKFDLRISPERWELDSWSWKDLQVIENKVISTVNEYDNPNKILIFCPSDNVFTENYLEECEKVIENLIDSNIDFIPYSFQKAVTANFLSRPYPPMQHWRPMDTITKFQSDIVWGDIMYAEAGIDASREPNHGYYPWKNFVICYDMFKFTRENIVHKISRHPGFVTEDKLESFIRPGIDEYISDRFVRKLKDSIGIYPCRMDEHPKVARDTFLFTLDDTHFGMNLFDHLSDFFKG